MKDGKKGGNMKEHKLKERMWKAVDIFIMSGTAFIILFDIVILFTTVAVVFGLI